MSLTYTPNHGSIITNPHIGLNLSNAKFDTSSYEDLNKNGIWFIFISNKSYQGPMSGDGWTIHELIDNFGCCWNTGKINSYTILGGYPIVLKKTSEGLGHPMPDKVIDELLETKKKCGGSNQASIELTHALVLLYAHHATEGEVLKIKHSELTTEVEELKKKVEELSSVNEKLESIIHKNRWNILF